MNIYGVIQGNGDIHSIKQTRVDSILQSKEKKKKLSITYFPV